MGRPWEWDEPPLREVVRDPIVTMMMRTDGVTSEALWRLIETAQARLQDGVLSGIEHRSE